MTDFIDDSIQHIFSKLLNEASRYLTLFLEKELPPLYDDWWNKGVIEKLSYGQSMQVQQRGITSLGMLDLAALLRTLDQNWYPLSTKLGFVHEARHYVKEMQTIRNRWAHAATEGFLKEDVYRDLDTLQRFAEVIGVKDSFICEVREAKEAVIGSKDDLSEESIQELTECLAESHEEGFVLGQMVSLRSDPQIRGAVISVLPGKKERRYKVLVNNDTKIFYASQLDSEEGSDEGADFFHCDMFHAYLTALQIRHPGLSVLYSLNAARVDYIPYQFRPVLRFIRSDRPRLLIADGVGVGKTIEAGLILRELQARRDIRSVLIICPRALIVERKWKNEMKRFDEDFVHLDSKSLRYCINETDLEGGWPEQYQKVIMSYSSFDDVLLHGSQKGRRKKSIKGLIDLDPPPRFDLVIVDEAHHIRNPETFRHKAVRYFCEHAEAAVFLTATPIQLGSDDLFVLLNTLRPDLVIDQESFKHMTEPNPFINKAISLLRSQSGEWRSEANKNLQEAATTAWGKTFLYKKPEYVQIQSLLTTEKISDEERIQMISELEEMHTFSGIINRTRRRDIGDFTIRKPETRSVPFTLHQQQLHDSLLKVQAEIYEQVHDDINIKFLMTTIRRQAASCLFGLIPFLEDILTRHLDLLFDELIEEREIILQEESFEAITSQITSIIERAHSLDSDDPKLDALREIIHNKQTLPNNKVMLFSTFRHTLAYLYQNLKKDGVRVGLVNGDTPDDERVRLRSRFEKDKNDPACLDVLLFSEIGCEGLDYQFCDCIVNYDLPWNPMRIEQRIGRIDRNGQKSESVAIVNLITPGTVDADIYERCLKRIGVFEHSLGDSEEILGEITKEIRSIAENYKLSEEERRAKFQQLSDNKIRLVREHEALEQRQLELFGIALPEERINKEVEDATSFWLSAKSIQRLVSFYLKEACGSEQEFILGEKALKTLRLSQSARNVLLSDFQKLDKRGVSSYRTWEQWLKEDNPHLSVTFESDCAIKHPEAIFIMPQHPLVLQAAQLFKTKKRTVTTAKVQCNKVPPGRYRFAIYQWLVSGIKEDLILQPVASDEKITTHLNDLLERASDLDMEDHDELDIGNWDDLEEFHYQLWQTARSEHREKVQDSVKFRQESLATSHKARMSLLEEQYRQTTNEKIQKMRQAQISNARGDYERRIQELNMAIERAEITAEPVAYGIIEVRGEESYAE